MFVDLKPKKICTGSKWHLQELALITITFSATISGHLSCKNVFIKKKCGNTGEVLFIVVNRQEIIIKQKKS